MNAPATLRALIDERAAQYPDRPFLLAVRDADDTRDAAPGVLSFGALQRDCATLSARFAQAGLRAGDVVSFFMSNGMQTARLLLAAMYGGFVANPVNLLSQASQLRYIVEHSDTRAIFVEPPMHAAVRAALDALHAEGVTRDIALIETAPDADTLPGFTPLALAEPALAGAPSATNRDFAAQPAATAAAIAQRAASPCTIPLPADGGPQAGDVALLMYTSGTTGAPKGVLLTHRNLLVNARNVSEEHRLGSADRVLASLPLYHINGLVVTLLAPLFHAGSVVMAPRFSVRTFWRDVAQHACTWINVVPTIVAYLLNDEARCSLDLSALRFCRSASAALPRDHHRAFEARFGVGIVETMGMTEAAAPIFSNPYDVDKRRIGSIGLPSGCEAKVIAPDGRECAADECGELVLRGEQVMRGYYKRPEDTRAAFTEEGWLRTGDLGYRDEAGYFYINGRAKELIIKGGENIAPREIDEALLRHPGVLEAAAVGVPDVAYGQDIVAFVVPRVSDGAAPPDVAELQEHCLRELGRYKTPKEFRFVSELPRGPSGKVQRLKLCAS
jgi:long-chain acyl-CoA synthetase